jgi:aspartate-semialdehyde dehydrogenase
VKICILGATGLVGRESIDLCARAWPGAELSLFASRDQKLEHGGRTYDVKGAPALEAADAPRGDLALVALDDDHSARYVPRLLALGYRVVDKSNTYRLDPKVPLVVAGANHALISEQVYLVANPNCTTMPLVLALAPLARKFGLASVTVSTYQAVSGAGIVALDEFLEDSRRGYIEPERLGERFNTQKYAGNTVPHHGKTDDSGFSAEERKLMQESRKILALPHLPLSAQCCRVAVAVGHYLNGWFTLEEGVQEVALESIWTDAKQAPFIRYFPGASGESSIAVAT